MRKELLIFGAGGALGRGLTNVLIRKDYDKVYLLDFKLPELDYPPTVQIIQYENLAREENIVSVFNRIMPGKDKNLFLYSTVGGFLGGKSLWETGSSEWDEMFDLNLKSSFLIAKHFSLKVKECNAGSILFTAAFAALAPEAGKSAYTSSKDALIKMIETLALEGVAINLTANAIAPFIIDTPANRQWADKDTDFEKWIKPEEIGELAHSIFSNFDFISGNVFKLKIRISQSSAHK